MLAPSVLLTYGENVKDDASDSFAPRSVARTTGRIDPDTYQNIDHETRVRSPCEVAQCRARAHRF
ncbi:MAG: hypothetical protein CNF01_01865 [Halieaceae bacterium MED-G27]|nr:hypothetical protein [Halieaceae bacterium]OUT66262.1 MAG: hypothetical protein CBB81_04420 [Cellvibrionales bacterium TMED21]PDH38349.1 MAG: hypothetical protein CNF01_01865 [Halieaceae bacterium MED-G27]